MNEKFDEYYEFISSKVDDKIFSVHKITKDIVRLLFDEAEIRGLNTREILQILDIAKEMFLKFKPSIPKIY